MTTVATPLSVRLRALLIEHASEATLTCTFVPGGRFGGVGIRGPLWCANCSQGHLWHLIAEGLALIETAEEITRTVADYEEARDRIAALVAGVENASRIADDILDFIHSSRDREGGRAS